MVPKACTSTGKAVQLFLVLRGKGKGLEYGIEVSRRYTHIMA